jgi:eukaryotic-like serine/threonine-protein kinase
VTAAGAEDPRIRLDALFEEALELQDGARDAFVRAIENEDATLARELQALLRLAGDTSNVLQPERAGHVRWQALFDDAPPTGNIKDTLPERIGVWLPLRRIGHGGMGTVYLVERSDGEFHQMGALKLLHVGAESEHFLERFARERQILASLTHPGIARLLDGGRSGDDRPYLVMEYVEGEALDRTCDCRCLDIGTRVALFVEIAEAVAHAHRNLVAHRDLKPNNILVGADGRPKLLDFGIAKALAEASGEESHDTRTALRAFTPDYATPEQVLGQPTSTATDIYQLGLLLYELLTGHRAQHAQDASQRALEEAICNREPLRPSERIGDDDRQRCAARSTTSNALRRKLRGDLDTIVLKALRKAPERRYASVNALIDDLERWRTGRPVRARPESWRYHTGKFLKRNAWAVAAGVAFFALLSGYAVTSTLQARTISRERDRAQAEAEKTTQTLALIKRVFLLSDPRETGGIPLTARQALDAGWASIEGELEEKPEIAVEVINAVGDAYHRAGDFKKARDLFAHNIAIIRRLSLHPSPLILASAQRGHGRALSELTDYTTAESELQAALLGYRNAYGERHKEVAAIMADIALLHVRRGDQRDAEVSLREVLAMQRELYGERHPLVAETLSLLGMTLRQQGDYAAAKPLLEQALTLRRQILSPQHPDLFTSLSNLAMIRSDLGDYDAAESLYREAMSGMQASLGNNHRDVANIKSNLGRLLQSRGDYTGARTLLEDALRIRMDTFGERHRATAANLNDIGLLLSKSGSAQKAESFYRRALDAYPSGDKGRGATVFNIGQLAENRSDYATAERRYREALALQRKDFGPGHDRVGADLNRLGIVLHRQGRLDEAEASIRQALAIYRKALPAGHPRLATVLMPLGELLIDRDRSEEAEPLLREAWQVRQKAFGDDDPKTIDAARALSRATRKD